MGVSATAIPTIPEDDSTYSVAYFGGDSLVVTDSQGRNIGRITVPDDHDSYELMGCKFPAQDDDLCWVWSTSGRFLFVYRRSICREINMWDSMNWKTKTLRFARPVKDFTLCCDDRVIVVACGCSVAVYDAYTQKKLKEMSTNPFGIVTHMIRTFTTDMCDGIALACVNEDTISFLEVDLWLDENNSLCSEERRFAVMLRGCFKVMCLSYTSDIWVSALFRDTQTHMCALATDVSRLSCTESRLTYFELDGAFDRCCKIKSLRNNSLVLECATAATQEIHLSSATPAASGLYRGRSANRFASTRSVCDTLTPAAQEHASPTITCETFVSDTPTPIRDSQPSGDNIGGDTSSDDDDDYESDASNWAHFRTLVLMLGVLWALVAFCWSMFASSSGYSGHRM